MNKRILKRSIFLVIFFIFILNIKAFAESDFTYEESDGKLTITGYKGSAGELTIPSTIDAKTVVAIKDHAFHERSGSDTKGKCLKKVTISEGIKTIGLLAFCGCDNLETVTFPESLTDMGAQSFLQCSKLKAITIPAGVTQIQNSAFQETALEEVIIPGTVTRISSAAFRLCSQLKRVKIESKTVVFESNDVFGNCNEDLVIYAENDSTAKTYANTNGISFKLLSEYPNPGADVPVTSLTLNKTKLTLKVGENQTLVSTIAPTNATNKTVTWESTNVKVATVSSSGKVTAVAKGTATIIASNSDETIKARCDVTVTEDEDIAVTSIKLNKTSLALKIDDTETLTATISPTDATDKTVTWSSSDTKVATVSDSGKITAKSVGSTVITATTADGKQKATCNVSVSKKDEEKPKITEIKLNKTSITLKVDETETLKATIEPDDASDEELTWSTSNSSVATVKDGKITAKKAGSATITVTNEDGSVKATCKVQVEEKVSNTPENKPTNSTSNTAKNTTANQTAGNSASKNTDNSTSNKTLPKTGASNIFLGIVILSGISIVMCKKYNDLRKDLKDI